MGEEWSACAEALYTGVRSCTPAHGVSRRVGTMVKGLTGDTDSIRTAVTLYSALWEWDWVSRFNGPSSLRRPRPEAEHDSRYRLQLSAHLA